MTPQEIEEKVQAYRVELEAQAKDQPKKGELYEVWDEGYDDEPCVRRFGEFTECGKFLNLETLDDPLLSWDYYRKLTTPATRIPWSGGEMPVDESTYVVVECRSGSRWLSYADKVDWDNTEMVAYWILED